MRYLTGPERAIIADPEGHWEFLYLEVTNFDGTWINLGALAVGEALKDFLNTHSLSDDIDRNTLTFTATMRREIGAYSLVPFRTTSPLNVDDLGDYQPLLDVHREWRLWISIQPRHTFPSGEADFREWARGVVDRIDIQGEPATISIQARGPEADLIDSLILCSEEDPVTFSAGPIADVLQAMLDYQFPATYTLVVDGSAPSTFINELELTEPVSFWQKFSDVAAVGTGVVRFLYASDDTLAIHLFTPNRSATVADWTIGGDEYEKLDVGIALDTVANYAVVRFINSSGAVQQVTSPASPVSASISRYGLRPIVITLAQKEGIDETNAQPLADAIVADRELPIMEQTVEGTGLWFGGLWDYVGMTANSIHYDEDQAGGVTGYTQTSENGVITSVFQLRGKPAGRYATWLQISSPTAPGAGDVAPGITSSSATFKEVSVLFVSVAAVVFVSTVNGNTQSVTVDLYSDSALTTLVDSNAYNATSAAPLTGAFLSTVTPLARDIVYYVKITPYSGPLVSGVPSGAAGEYGVANTNVLPEPTDTPTVSWDRSDPAKLQANVIPGPTSGIAPSSADYLVKTASGALSAERVVTDTTTIETDWATAGQAKIKIVSSAPLPGSPTTTTQSQGDNSTKVATTAYVDTGLALKAPLASPTFTGDPKAPTPSPGDNDTSIATTAFVTAAIAAGGGGSVGWRYSVSSTFLLAGNAQDMVNVGTSHSVLVVSVFAASLAFNAAAEFVVPVNAFGGSPVWAIARPSRYSNTGDGIGLEVRLNNGTIDLRVRNDGANTFDALTLTVQSESESAPTFTSLTGTAQAAITTTALYGYERQLLSGLEQAGAASLDLLTWDNTNKKWKPAAIAIPSSGATPGTYGDASHVAAITVGSDGRITGVSSVNISGLGGGASAEVLITETVLGASASTITFSSIANTYRDLHLVVRGRGTTAATFCRPRLQMNGDTGNNYDWQREFSHTSTVAAEGGGTVGGTGVAFVDIGLLPASTAPSGQASASKVRIFDYRGTTFHKPVLFEAGGYAIAERYSIAGAGLWRSTSAITSLTLILDAGSFDVGTVASLYGIY